MSGDEHAGEAELGRERKLADRYYRVHGDASDEGQVALLQARLAEAHRGLHADEQALLEERLAGRNAFVVAAAAHAYCASRLDELPESWIKTHDALLAAHRATTPSETPATHVVVEVDELERLRRGAIANEYNERALQEIVARLGSLCPCPSAHEAEFGLVDDPGPRQECPLHGDGTTFVEELARLKRTRCDHLCDWCPPGAGA